MEWNEAGGIADQGAVGVYDTDTRLAREGTGQLPALYAVHDDEQPQASSLRAFAEANPNLKVCHVALECKNTDKRHLP